MNWLGFREEKKMKDPTVEPPKLKIMPPRQESTDSTTGAEGMQLGERRTSVTLVDMVGPLPPPLPKEPVSIQQPQPSQQRRDSDIDRLYRLSNLMHACGSRDD